MNGLELLEKYPKATSCIKKWFMQRMLNSFDDNTVPKEFKDSMLQEGVSNDKLAVMIEAQPRSLFDVFDNNQLYIFIDPEVHPLDRELHFNFKIISPILTIPMGRIDIGKVECSSRKEAEELAIEEVFWRLEYNLNNYKSKN